MQHCKLCLYWQITILSGNRSLVYIANDRSRLSRRIQRHSVELAYGDLDSTTETRLDVLCSYVYMLCFTSSCSVRDHECAKKWPIKWPFMLPLDSVHMTNRPFETMCRSCGHSGMCALPSCFKIARLIAYVARCSAASRLTSV